MAHFAKIDENNLVTEVIVIDNKELLDDDIEKESFGIDFINNTLGMGGNWLQTSYNTFGNQHNNNKTPFRANFAGIGFTYDNLNDVFIAPEPTIPGNTYTLNTETFLWEKD